MNLPLHLLNKDDYSFDFQEYRKKYSWVEDMYNTQQDPVFHTEGNVGIHTEMVMSSIVKDSNFGGLTEREKEILFVGSLFHDVEKRSTTFEEGGHIVSPGHAKKGELTTRSILYRDFDTDFQTREQICKLVRHHGLPLWIFSKPNPVKTLIESSMISNTYWLYLVALADVHGRIASDKDDLLYRIELFKEYALEKDVWNKSKKFENEHSKLIFFEHENSYVDYVPFQEFGSMVTIMSGLPGSGKDYYIKKNIESKIPIISLDELRRQYKIKPGDKYGTGFIVQKAKEKAREYLRVRTPFVWNATNLTKQIREQVIGLMREYKAYVKIVYTEVPYKKLKEQNQNREYPIPEKDLERFINRLEMPSVTEAHEIIYNIKQ